MSDIGSAWGQEIEKICSMYSSLSEKIAVADSEGRLVFLSSAFKEDVYDSRFISDLFGNEGRLVFERADAEKRAVSVPLLWKEGWAELTVTPLGDYHILQLLEKAEAKAQAPAADARLFVERETRNTLTLLMAALETVKKGMPEDDKMKRSLAVIRQGLNRLLRLISNMADLDRFRDGRLNLALQTGNLAAFAEKLCQRMAPFFEKQGLSFSWEIPAVPVYTAFDEKQIERMLLNVLSNSMKASPRGGAVILDFKAEKDRVRITVKDEGRGLKPPAAQGAEGAAYLEIAAAEAAGMGLAVASAVAALHGGRLLLENRPEGGVAAYVTLPIVKRPEAFRNTRPEYMGGLDSILVELSPVLPVDFYY